MPPLEQTVLLIFIPLPPTLQGENHHSSHLTDEESELSHRVFIN